jgi:bifunctional non-homologous end joining protein LigD
MAETLQPYWNKRNFGVTPEPKGKAGTPAKALAFVIQKHAARQLHYDFRLELDGTLKSWAVPKGPSLDPADKRMAVHVEDHPLDYANFEGVIPAKQYGAGTVIVWDRGEWIPVGDPHAGYRDGKLKFELRGEKLRGGWTLVRMRGRAAQESKQPWLLIKERDQEARPAAQYSIVEALPDSVLQTNGSSEMQRGTAKVEPRPVAKGTTKRIRSAAGDKPSEAMPQGAVKANLPLTLAPQLATLVDTAPAGDWSYEIKFDGYRVLVRIDGDDVRIFTRNGHNWSSKMPALVQSVKTLGFTSGWLDGEIVVMGPNGVPSFQLLQNAFDTSRTSDIVLFVFDLPFYNGYDLRNVPQFERRGLLKAALAESKGGNVQFSEDFDQPPEQILETVCQLHMEGVIGKRRDSRYESRRSPNWIKLKCVKRQEFVIGGFTDPKGSREGFGSLLIGVHDPDGRLRFCGGMGTGFDGKTLRSLREKLSKLETDKSPFQVSGVPLPKAAHWVRPKLVAEGTFAEWTGDGIVRQAVFHGLRTDKEASAIIRELSKAVGTGAEAPAMGRQGARGKGSSNVVQRIKITNPDRVIDPSSGITKLDLVRYYQAVADLILPHLKGRPVSLVRGPDGIQGELFFQKHAETLNIPGIRNLDPALDPEHLALLEIDSAEGLVGAAQMNTIELHTWNATKDAIERPDRMTFDLDPGEGLSWGRVIEAAEIMKVMLEELSLQGFLKTSGGKGLHIVVPIAPKLDWDTVKDLSQAVVQHLASTFPDRFVIKSGGRNRVGKLFIDYLRNGRGATTVAAYSARARPGMGVSIPLSWDELRDIKSGAQWTISNVHERLDEQRRTDPWSEYKKSRQTLATAMKTLGFKAGKS